MSENPSSKSSKVQTDNADIRSNNATGGALVISNDKAQTSGDLVKVTGTAGQSALNVAAGNVSISGNTTFGGQMTGYHRLATGDIRGLTVVEKTDGNTDTGFTMEVNKLTNSLYDGDGAAAGMVVPALAAGEVAVFRFAAQADGGQSIVFTLNSAQTFNAESLPLRAAVPADGSSGSYIPPEATVAQGKGTGTKDIDAAHKKITIATTATDNQTNIGSYLVFCGTGSNKVSVGFKPVTLGSGAINATFTFA